MLFAIVVALIAQFHGIGDMLARCLMRFRVDIYDRAMPAFVTSLRR